MYVCALHSIVACSVLKCVLLLNDIQSLEFSDSMIESLSCIEWSVIPSKLEVMKLSVCTR